MGAESYTGRINRKLSKKLRIVEVAAGREKADLVIRYTILNLGHWMGKLLSYAAILFRRAENFLNLGYFYENTMIPVPLGEYRI